MKIKLEIGSYHDLAELVKLLGMSGYKVWRESEKENLISETIEYLLIEIDNNCIIEN